MEVKKECLISVLKLNFNLENSIVIESPCINICKINTDSGLCMGCCRDEFEVFNWINFSDKEKELILSKIKSRVKSNNDQNNNKSLFIRQNKFKN